MHNGKKVVFVSGANRGIGLEFARQLSEVGYVVIGGYRDPEKSQDLLTLSETLSDFNVFRGDATYEEDIKRLSQYIRDHFKKLDVVINNAGINLKYESTIDDVDPDDIMENFRVNIIGPFLVGKYLRPLMSSGNGSKIINITSQMGSIQMSNGGSLPYRLSKAALNMLTRNQSLAYRDFGIITVGLHPGWVRTEMGGPKAPLDPAETVSMMLGVIENLTPEDSGAFLTYDGRVLPY
ncbi:MAG: SDR family oxidoreductase [FCB group bacterium]|nr:SDR family oxidoreductase [FCB group bacterium]